MPTVRGDWVDAIVWEWVKLIIDNPENLCVSLDNVQNGLQQTNQALLDRLAFIDDQIQEQQKQLDKLLDLYLGGEFPKEMLTERKSHLEQMLTNLSKEQNGLAEHIRKVTITDDQLSYIEAFCAKIRNGLDQADFNTKRQIIELLDVRGKIAFENNEKVLYLKCLITQQPLAPIVISHSSSRQKGNSVVLTARFVLGNEMTLTMYFYSDEG